MSEVALPEIAPPMSQEMTAAVWRALTRHDALDLAEMLGLLE